MMRRTREANQRPAPLEPVEASLGDAVGGGVEPRDVVDGLAGGRLADDVERARLEEALLERQLQLPLLVRRTWEKDEYLV